MPGVQDNLGHKDGDGKDTLYPTEIILYNYALEHSFISTNM